MYAYEFSGAGAQCNDKTDCRQFASIFGTLGLEPRMRPRHASWPLAAALSLLAGAPCADDGAPDPLFATDDVLELRIEAPLDTLLDERPDDEYLPGQLTWRDASGADVSVYAGVRTRGKSRRSRQICIFPPVRLNVRKSEVDDTLFDGQDKLKLVSHCRTGSSRYEQSVLREYLVYRMLNELTPTSFRVRRLRVTWVDTERDGKSFTAPGFLIESDERFARRVGLPVAEVTRTRVSVLDPDYTNLVSVFQFFIGNTDFSPIVGPPGEPCCHNTQLFGDPESRLFPVPYDFDMTGMVNAPYGAPNPEFRLASVQSRLYRGRCANNGRLDATAQHFIEHREALYALVDAVDELGKRARRDMTRFMDRFYDDIGDAAKRERLLADKCIN